MAKEIFFSKPVNHETVAELIEQIGEEKELTIFLNSTGGHSIEAIAFYNYIKFRKVNLTINVVGECESAAIIILCAGKKRVSSKYSSFLLHMLRRIYDGKFSFTVKNLIEQSEELAECEKNLQQIITETTGTQLETLLQIFQAEKNLTADEAFRLGLLTEKPY